MSKHLCERIQNYMICVGRKHMQHYAVIFLEPQANILYNFETRDVIF